LTLVRFRSLQSRITALYSATFGLVMILVAVVMQWAIADSAEDKVRSELVSSAAVIDRIWAMRGTEMESVAREPKRQVLIPASNHRFTDRLGDLRRAYAESLNWIGAMSGSR